jgi:hypothetical protein
MNKFDNITFEKTLGLSDSQAGSGTRQLCPSVPAEIVLEPTRTGVRVTARLSDHRLLFGYSASSGNLKDLHIQVASYPALIELITEHLMDTHPEQSAQLASVPSTDSSLAQIHASIADLSERALRISSETSKIRGPQLQLVASRIARVIAIEMAELNK